MSDVKTEYFASGVGLEMLYKRVSSTGAHDWWYRSWPIDKGMWNYISGSIVIQGEIDHKSGKIAENYGVVPVDEEYIKGILFCHAV